MSLAEDAEHAALRMREYLCPWRYQPWPALSVGVTDAGCCIQHRRLMPCRTGMPPHNQTSLMPYARRPTAVCRDSAWEPVCTGDTHCTPPQGAGASPCHGQWSSDAPPGSGWPYIPPRDQDSRAISPLCNCRLYESAHASLCRRQTRGYFGCHISTGFPRPCLISFFFLSPSGHPRLPSFLSLPSPSCSVL